MRAKEKLLLQDTKEGALLQEKVSWHDSIHDIQPITGCILSNEVVDNFPVHQVIMEDELMEVFVGYDNEFTELLRPAPKALTNYLEQLNVDLPRGFRTEINLQAIEWIRGIAESLKEGFVLTIDYGYPSSGLYSGGRNSGTLVCYHKHNINYCPYDHIGEQDITTHVNFSALCHWGLSSGLEYCGFTNQSYFMRALGLARHLKKMEERREADPVSERQKAFLIQNLLMEMGSKFKVLIQQKGLRQPRLSGLQFTQLLA
jgi:SAM-dependent MidA family methyltransferase